MKRFLLNAFLGCFYLVVALFSVETSAQNIFSGEPIQWAGRPNGYSTTPYNSDYRTTIYRKISTTTSNPSDGRGQWATTINVQTSGGNIAPDNMPGGGGAGWLLISGPSGNRFQNKWNFNGVGQAALNAINGIVKQGGGEDMGLNMGTSGYYTFVMRDAGYVSSEVYIAYTANDPVSVANGGVSYSGGQPVVSITSGATPSAGENIYVRYRVGTNDFTSSTALVQASGSGTSWTATLPTQSCNATVYYYIFTSTRTLAQLNSDSEQNRSLVAIRYDDSFGSNHSFSISQSSASVLTGGDSLCQGESTDLQVAITGGLSPYEVVYSDGSSNFTVSGYTSGALIAVSPSTTKTFTLVSVTGNNGCAGVSLSGSAIVTVSPNVTYYEDTDEDGYGNPVVSQITCTGAPEGFVTNSLDTNDNLLTYEDIDGDGFGSIYLAPSGPTNNTDCDDEDDTKHTTFSFYEDTDEDGVGSGSLQSGVCAVDANTPPVGYSLTNTDCAPNDGTAYQEGTFYSDADGDNYALTNTTTTLCYGATEPAGYSLVNLGLDCNDDIAAINPGNAEILYNGFDDNCNDVIDEGFQITSNMVNCGTTLSTISSLIHCVSKSGVNGYRFEVTNTLTNTVQTIDKPYQYFSLTELANFEYATTYSIRVMVRKTSNNVWLGYYGTACLYSTPPVTSPAGGAGSIQLQTYCGGTLPTISTIISTTSLPGATGYRFRVTNTNTGAVQVLPRTLHWFSLTMLASYNYGTAYIVDVAVKTTGDYSDYGAPCNVTTPAVPTLVNYCGGAIVPAKSSLITTSSLDRVTAYEFTVDLYNEELELVSTSVVVKSLNRFSLNDITNYAPNTTYSVRVRVFSSGSWSPYGDACELVSPGTAKQVESKESVNNNFNVIGYPNPYDYQFSFLMESLSEAVVSIKVYDMVGKLIENREINASDMPMQSLGERYASGVYNVVVTQDEQVKSFRMIKR